MVVYGQKGKSILMKQMTTHAIASNPGRRSVQSSDLVGWESSAQSTAIPFFAVSKSIYQAK
jgi:hypothetical protein